jgi:hypothetical protein
MILERNARRMAAAFLTAALVTAPAVASRSAASSLGDGLRGPLSRCGRIAACAAGSVDATLDTLSSAFERLPAGAAGPSAWLRQAAAIAGIRTASAPRFAGSARDGVLALYREAHVRVQASRVDAALGAVSTREAAAVGDLAGSLATALRLSREALSGAGVERVLEDPIRAMHVVTLVSGGMRPELRGEYEQIVASLNRIDKAKMALAGLVITDAIGRARAGVFTDDVNLPLISIGNDGDTTYSDLLLVQVDNSGNDTYLNNAGGMAIAIDYGAGNDTYSADTTAQGSGTGAPGILYDEGGTDSYSVRQFGQGMGVAAVGMLYDAGTGDDVYTSPGADPIGTKAGSLGGIGVLVDEGGADTLQQDGLDGFVYGAAGIGLMANLGDGNDTYTSNDISVVLLGEDLGKFTGPVQISAEAGGVAILYEEGGSDTYTCGQHVRQGCQSAAGVGAFSLLWDLAGDDTYSMGVSITPMLIGEPSVPIDFVVFPMGQGAGYGPSAPAGPGLGILRDEDGADTYTAEKWAQGYASLSGLGLLYDTGSGADAYTVPAPVIGSRANDSEWFDGTGGFGIDR